VHGLIKRIYYLEECKDDNGVAFTLIGLPKKLRFRKLFCLSAGKIHSLKKIGK